MKAAYREAKIKGKEMKKILNLSEIAFAGGKDFGKYEKFLRGSTYVTQKIPPDYLLEQNFPNPFNTTTRIKFGLPKISKVSLRLYDIVGDRITIMLDDEPLKPGTYSHWFNADGLPSGIYYYSLVADERLIGVRKMMLIK